MSEFVHKSHNVTVLMYHLVFPAKYRRAVFDDSVDEVFERAMFGNFKTRPDEILGDRVLIRIMPISWFSRYRLTV